MATILIEQAVEAHNSALGDVSNTEYRWAQSFTLASEKVIEGVSLLFGTKSGSPTGQVTYRIETDSGGVPSGTLAHASAIKAFTPTISAWNYESFASSFILPAGTYWLVALCDNQATGVYWYIRDADADEYAGGMFARSTDGGSSWTAYPAYDLTFRIYEEIAPSIVGWKNLLGVGQGTILLFLRHLTNLF